MKLVATGGARTPARLIATLTLAALVTLLAGTASAASSSSSTTLAAASGTAQSASTSAAERQAAKKLAAGKRAKKLAAKKRARKVFLARRAAKVRANKVEKVLRTAASLKGRPYSYGAIGPSAFDCSGYTGYVLRKAGESLPRTSRAQYAAAKHISKGSVKPGDLVFYRSGGRIYHVAIYAGKGRVWHARQQGQPVARTPISTSNWVAGRVL